MDELETLLRSTDRIQAPDLWSEARRRAERSDGPSVSGPDPRRLVAAGVALAVFAAGAVFAWRLFTTARDPGPSSPTTEGPPVSATPSAGLDPLAGLPGGWTELTPPPEVLTDGAMVWTGAELLTWSGSHVGGDRPWPTGFSFDPSAGRWDELPPAPIPPRVAPAYAWTGAELLVWGGHDGTWTGEGQPEVLGDGAAYDPTTNTWRVLPEAPISGRAPMFAWTGRELIVWGTSLRTAGSSLDGAAYDPATDAWRRIADGPVDLTDATAVWTGSEVIVFGAALHGGNVPETETAIGAAYDPLTDTWRRISDSDLSPQASTAAWDGREMIAWDYLNGTAAYDPGADTWRPLHRVPLDDYECAPVSVALGTGHVFGNYCGLLTLFDPSTDAWRDITRKDLLGAALVPVPAGEVVIVIASVTYKDVDPDLRTLAYRPER